MRHPTPGLVVHLLAEAKLLSHDKLQTFKDLREDIVKALLGTASVYEGIKTPSLPKLTGILKGFRRGELVILTGPTGAYDALFFCIPVTYHFYNEWSYLGSGKTTILSQISLDFAKQVRKVSSY